MYKNKSADQRKQYEPFCIEADKCKVKSNFFPKIIANSIQRLGPHDVFVLGPVLVEPFAVARSTIVQGSKWVVNPSVPESLICVGSHWRHIGAFPPLRRDCARLRDLTNHTHFHNSKIFRLCQRIARDREVIKLLNWQMFLLQLFIENLRSFYDHSVSCNLIS